MKALKCWRRVWWKLHERSADMKVSNFGSVSWAQSLLHYVLAVAAIFFSSEVARNCSVQGESITAAFLKKVMLPKRFLCLGSRQWGTRNASIWNPLEAIVTIYVIAVSLACQETNFGGGVTQEVWKMIPATNISNTKHSGLSRYGVGNLPAWPWAAVWFWTQRGWVWGCQALAPQKEKLSQ